MLLWALCAHQAFIGAHLLPRPPANWKSLQSQFSSPDLRLWLGWRVSYCPQAAAPWLRRHAIAPLIILFLEHTR